MKFVKVILNQKKIVRPVTSIVVDAKFVETNDVNLMRTVTLVLLIVASVRQASFKVVLLMLSMVILLVMPQLNFM